MRRGSVSSWQSYGMRNSDCMMQTYEGNTALPPPCEEIVHQRKGGWFLTYKKILSFIVLFVIVVVVAGLIGWNIGTMPKTRIYDPLALIEEEVEEGEDDVTATISPFVHPTRYSLELTVSNDVNVTSKLKGRVVIEFRVDDTTPLNQLSLNARNITATRYKLSLIEENGARAKRRRRRRAEENDTGGQGNAADNATTLAPTVTSSPQLENQETTRVAVTDYPLGNATVSANETSPMTNESSSVPDEKITVTTNATTTSGPVMFATVTSGNGSATNDVEIQRYEVDANNGLHVIYPAVDISPGMYSLEIDYEALLDGKAIYSASFGESGDGKSFIGTWLKPVGASHLLPIFDDVNLKAIFSVSVVHPREMRVLANMPLNISKDVSDDQVIDIFSDTPLFSPHNLAIVMGEVESLAETKTGLDNATGVTFWGDPKRRSRGIYLLDKLDQIVVRLNDMFSMPYPLPKLDIVALPSRIIDNAGSPGLISLKQSLFYAADRSPMVTKTDALSALISLIGEQWLGGVVNMKNWTDIWLFEGTTLYLRHAIIEKIDSSLGSNHAFLANVQWDAMEEDGYSVSRPLQSNVNPLHLDFSDDDARDKKGACLIRMLHGVINDTAFRNGYRKFIARWNYSTASVNDFWETMAEETIGLPAEITLSEAMNSWTSHRGYPIVSVMRKYKEGTAVIRQQRFTYDQSPADTQPTWYVPLDYINKTSNDWSSPTKTWLHSETEMVVQNVGAQDSWVVFNVNKTGYYRVHYDEENWKLLTQALEENHEALPAETRASLIDDVLGLAAVGLTKYATAFDFIKYMQMKERHYAPWGALMRHLLKLNGLLYETSGFSAFQEFTLKFTSKLYSDMGWKIEEGSRLTLTALTIACAFENAECLEWARTHFEKLKDRSDVDEVVPAYAREVLYCTIARYGTRNEWNYFVERVNSTADHDERNRLLSAFACFQTPWILQSILSEILEGKMYDEDEAQRILRSFPQNPVAAQIAYKFVQNNWQVIVTRFSKSRPILKAFALAMTNGLISEEDFEDFQTFSEDNLESIKVVGYTMAMVEAHAKFAIKWLKESLPEVQEWLTAYNSTEVSV
ncbi:PREDICTED: thyrotropin-releasing hormone-degrading ectoenzyme-like isoform X3 [Wasmannia auropunctata]|uniref:thyrotropin-releasing hormone-degrading ectoenzyme-like isoform X3 n=1 Tax=Wasmannia auropunctata TaxID=64793 RepID=UPI0005EF2A23|nr:PREDICTED: thyrotropin-releasing hormone-degrading ectoenzyme-like isoform X3 [Wasmannia auropunctata]